MFISLYHHFLSVYSIWTGNRFCVFYIFSPIPLSLCGGGGGASVQYGHYAIMVRCHGKGYRTRDREQLILMYSIKLLIDDMLIYIIL